MNFHLEKDIPICVDLDKTLSKTDTLQEAIISLIKENPFNIFFFFFWFSKGLVNFKNEVFTKANINVELLPFNYELIEYLKQLKSNGNKIYLVTASVQFLADQISNAIPIFEESFGTGLSNNLKGINKKNFLNEKFGEGRYIYVGDSKADLKVWNSAKGAIVIGSHSFVKKVQNITKVYCSFNSSNLNFIKIIKAIRVYQWVKNILLFLPLLLAHKLNQSEPIINVILGFLSFSLISSSVYVFNDLLDLENDRVHPKKRFRPFASGDISSFQGIFIGIVLILCSFVIGYQINNKFLFVLASYFVISNLYSLKLKQEPIIDILIIAGLFTIRMYAGSIAADAYISTWFLAFSLFLFLSLASVKRYNEILQNIMVNKEKVFGRGYSANDNVFVLALGIGAGLITVLIYLLYVNSSQVSSLYTNSSVLILNTPLLLYWNLRLWHQTNNGKMSDDPIIFTIKDKVSYIVFALIFFITYMAI
jgi:4-hydroxybenzoate polyprenyltransferase